MTPFVVTHEDARRRVVHSRVVAADAAAACAALRLAPDAVLMVQPADAAAGADPAAPAPPARAPRRWRGTAFPLGLFSHELAVLLDAGIPLLEALRTLREKEAAPAVAQVLAATIATLGEGRPLSHALHAQPAAFDALFIATVEASERTGQLALALRRHAAYMAWVASLRGRLVQAMVYPAVLLAAGLAVILFLLLFVVPRFAGLMDGARADLPWASQLLMSAGRAGGEHPWQVLAAVALLLAVPLVAWQQPALRAGVVAWLRRLPWLGPRLRLLELAMLYRTTSMLLAAGVPLVASLAAAAGVVGGAARAALARAAASVRAGGRLSDGLDAQGLVTPVALRMLRVGERTGELGAMLERAAAFHDEELLRSAELAARLVNPLLMLVMGVVIGGVIVLLYLPIFQLAEQVQ